MADAIWNDRYVLSNMTSEKLYAKSPLTTGVSGTSAYIGLEPSATYNETVLWSGNFASAAPLSEPMTNFDYVKVYYAVDFTNTNEYHQVLELDPNKGAHTWHGIGGLGAANAWLGLNFFSANNDYTILTIPKCKLINFGSFNTTGTAIAGSTTGANVQILYKVVGVNKKEV